jgi:hypothetical protein
MESDLQLIDRRQTGRQTAPDHAIVLARVRPGQEASVVDVSAHGVLIEIAHRLFPGRAIELHLETADQRVAVRGRVLRCSVAAVLASRMVYHGAIGFEFPLPWFATSGNDGYLVLGGREVDSRVS